MENLKIKNNTNTLCFYKTEKDLCKIVANHLSESIEEAIEVLNNLYL